MRPVYRPFPHVHVAYGVTGCPVCAAITAAAVAFGVKGRA